MIRTAGRTALIVAALAALGWLAAEAAAQSPKVVRTAPITMTGLGAASAASAREIRTGAITMTGIAPQTVTINTGRIEMTGRR